MDLTDFKSRSDKKKVFDAMAAASIFNNSAGVDTSRARVIPLDSFIHFLSHFQKDEHSEDEAKFLIQLHEPDPVLRSHAQLSFEGFARYLMDASNSAILNENDNNNSNEDMDQSLSKYYIATSHNTYLVGHQLKGHSSVHLYREILLTGCRCVELDCWDGDDGQPIIYHGHTLTTKISFREVVQTIADSAFINSPYPVILSIENHCSIPQQQKMATIFKELLGDRLVTAPLSENETTLPSPNQLRHKIIIKNKKLRTPTFNMNSSNLLGIRNSNNPALNRSSTIDDNNLIEDDYDSDYGDDEYDDDIQDEIGEQNMSLEDYQLSLSRQQQQQLQQQQRPRTLSMSPSMHMQNLQQPKESAESSVLSSSKKKKENCLISRELSDLVVYCQSVKFKGFGKPDHYNNIINNNNVIMNNYNSIGQLSDSPAYRKRQQEGGQTIVVNTNLPGGRRTGLLSLESTPSSSSGSLAGSLTSIAGGGASGFTTTITSGGPSMVRAATISSATSVASSAILNHTQTSSFDLSNPVYQCSSLHESRAKTLCRKQPQKMLDMTETQLVRVYPAGMRIDSSNFNPIPIWSCGIQMVAMNYQTPDTNLHIHNALFGNSKGYVLKPEVMWNTSHILYQRFLPTSKTQEGLHVTQISLTIVSGQYVCRENYGASSFVEIEVLGIPRDCSKFKTKMISRNALNPIWEETFEISIHLPELAFIKFSVLDVGGNFVTAQRILPVRKLRPGYRHLRLHNEHDTPLPLSQLFLCTQFVDGDLMEEEEGEGSLEQQQQQQSGNFSSPTSSSTITVNLQSKQRPDSGGVGGRKRMSFLVVHDINEQSPYAILKVPENATTREVIRQAVMKGGENGNEHEYVLLEETVVANTSGEDFLTTPPTQQRLVGMDERPLHIRSKWKADSKFVLKRVGTDPSWRARLGNLIIEDSNATTGHQPQQPESRKLFDLIQEDHDGEEMESEQNKIENFLVCVFNVSSKVSYSILQVPKTSKAADVIAQALAKSRRGEEEEIKPEKFVLVEETDHQPGHPNFGGTSSSSVSALSTKKGLKGKRRRVLDSQENVYLVQLGWKGAGRLILDEREKLLRDGQLYYLDSPLVNNHLHVCETQSDPLTSKMSPGLKRSSKIIASGVRRISRSFYGSHDTSSQHSNLTAGSSSRYSSHTHLMPELPPQQTRQRRVTTASGGGMMSLSPSSASVSIMESNGSRNSPNPRRPHRRSGSARLESRRSGSRSGDRLEAEKMRRGSIGVENMQFLSAGGEASEESSARKMSTARKLSKVTLRKLKIW